jgi:hypothetical protein
MARWPQLVAGYEALFRYADAADDPSVREFYNRFAESTDTFLRASREPGFGQLLAASGTLQSTLLGFEPSTASIGLMATLSLRPYTRLGSPFRGVFMRDLRALPNRALCTSWREIYERLLDGFRELRRLGRRGIHYAPVGEYGECHAVLAAADFSTSQALAAQLVAAADVTVDEVAIDDDEVLAFVARQDAVADVADDVPTLIREASRQGDAPFAGARWWVARRGGAIVGCVAPIATGPYKRYAVPRRLAERVAFYNQAFFERDSVARTDLFGFRVDAALAPDAQTAVASRLLRASVDDAAAWVCFRDAAWNPLPHALADGRVRTHTYQVFEVCPVQRDAAPAWRLAWEPLFLS